MLFSRPDGTRVADAAPLRRLLPHLMPTRTESAVYFAQQLDVSGTLAFLARRNADAAAHKLSFFHVLLAAYVRTLAQRPQLNRFVVGRRLYQRRDLALSFAVKKQFSDEGALTTVKCVFQPADTLDDVARRVEEAIAFARSSAESTADKETRFVTLLPRFLLRFVMGLQRAADYWNLLPAGMIAGDPLYASLFLANLGSIGLDAPYHHLYEYGTVPLFAAIGRIHKALVVGADGQPVVREVVDVKYTLDERVADGFYCARSLELFRQFVEQPSLLESPAADARAA